MLATFIIGLREGLEAALIVGIIAAFLRARGERLTEMWLGVAAAVALAVGVGAGLALVEAALPHSAQEKLECVIAAVAVVFVTLMVLWMTRHAAGLKGQIERDADAALGQGSRVALAAMAFLAVLREGFETAVFLLATISGAQTGYWAGLGAALGLAASVALGWAIAQGGMRLNLGRFFRWTGVFLILVAAGLVFQTLRSAHEAGWLLAGQQRIADLSWLVAPGTVRSALITGVLGIPADPRLIEVLGWIAYLIPVAALTYWPRALRPDPRTAQWLRGSLAVAFAVLAVGIAALWPQPQVTLPDHAPRVLEGDVDTSAGPDLRLQGQVLEMGATRVDLTGNEATPERHLGLPSLHRQVQSQTEIAGAPGQIDLATLAQLAGGRLPVGISPARNPGPFVAEWTRLEQVTVWTAGDALLDAQGRSAVTLRLSGGGLTTPRTLRVDAAPGGSATGAWVMAPAAAQDAADALRAVRRARIEHQFWARELPVILLLIALALAASALARARPASLFPARSL